MSVKSKPLFIISDGTGETAEKVVRACLLQFKDNPVQPQTYPNITSDEDLRKHFRMARDMDAFVVTTLVQADRRELARTLAEQYSLHWVDVVGSLLGGLSNYLRAAPRERYGLMHRADDRYFRRIAAVEFTVKADDGKEPRMLHQADIVLVGVSRTSKTPLSVFLAHKGYKVGNVPLILETEPPEQLWEVDQDRVFALTIDPSALKEIRHQRIEQMGRGWLRPDATNYGQIDYILAELDEALDLFARNREWPVIDVTNKAVEETAATILRVLAERGVQLNPLAEETGQL